MTQLKITLDESQVALVTQLLTELQVQYEEINTAEQKRRNWDNLPTSRTGKNLDNVNIRRYAYEEDEE